MNKSNQKGKTSVLLMGTPLQVFPPVTAFGWLSRRVVHSAFYARTYKSLCSYPERVVTEGTFPDGK